MKTNIKITLFGLLFTLPIFGQNPCTTANISLSADAYIDSRNTTTNYGGDVYLESSTLNSSGEFSRRSLMKANFSSISTASYIVSAKLKLKGAAHTIPTTSKAVVEKITSADWTETGVTWANQPVATTSGSVYIDAPSTNTQDYDNIEIGPFVQSWVSTPTSNYGMRLRLQTESATNGYKFYSNNYTAVAGKKPVIEVQYVSNLYMDWATLKNMGENTSDGLTKLISTTSSWDDMVGVSKNKLTANADGFILHKAVISNDYVRIGFSSGFEQSSDKMDFCFELNGTSLRFYKQNSCEYTILTITEGTAIFLRRVGSNMYIYINGNATPTITWACNSNIEYNAKVACKKNGGTGDIGFTKVSFGAPTVVTYTPSVSDANYIYSVTPLIPVSTVPAITATKNIGDYMEQVDYYDGLGRLLQNVSICGAPDRSSIIIPHEYDNMGREAIKYLPYSSTSNKGSYDASALTNQSNFYALAGTTPDIAKTAYPYSETMYDQSPLSRATEQSTPGEAWKVVSGSSNSFTYDGYFEFTTKKAAGEFTGDYTGRTAQVRYEVNSANDVYLFSVSGNTLQYTATYYPAGTLYKTVSRNENESTSNDVNATYEYKDYQGRVVLKRTFSSLGNPLNTYYVYDDYNLLRYVLSPAASASITTANYAQIIKDLCYYYEYDGEKRMIIKQLPGADPVYMLYDNRDRPIATQDGEQRKTNKWTFTKYDVLNRPIMTGIFQDTRTFTDLQTYVNTLSTFYETRGATLEGYTNLSFPTGHYASGSITSFTSVDILSVIYYDDYNYTGKLGWNSTAEIDNYIDDDGVVDGYFSRVTGKVTGTKTRVMDNMAQSNFIVNTLYYDEKGRVIESISSYTTSETDNTKKLFGTGYTETVANRYSFDGRVLESKDKQTVNGGINEVSKYLVYDHAGRLKQIFNQVSGDNTNFIVLESEMSYNKLGQLIKKILHKKDAYNNLQEINYKYNTRGWLTQINDPASLGTDLFGMKLIYEASESGLGNALQYNGNISGIIWNSTQKSKQAYSFGYDAVNRLTGSAYKTWNSTSSAWVESDKYEERSITYDKNGNIKGLTRTDLNAAILNNFTYNYAIPDKSNQLLNINGGTAYTYDKNGNTTKDGLRGFDITYNVLNLPSTVTKGAENIGYIYTASGQKIAKKNNGAFSLYYLGSMVYGNDKKLQYILTEEGMVEPSSTVGEYTYEYSLKDHLGNTRVVFDANKTIIQTNEYYAFGSLFEKNNTDKNKYLYNGKELQDDALAGTNFDWYDYGARFYDPLIGRWHVVDSKTEEFYNITPYSYAANNPVLFIDPTGQYIRIYSNGSYVDYDQNTDYNELDDQGNYKYDQFTRDAAAQISYLIKNAQDPEKMVQTLVEDKDYKLELREKDIEKGESNSANPGGQPHLGTNTLSYDPRAGVVTDKGGLQSGVAGLIHELGHMYKEDYLQYLEYKRLVSQGMNPTDAVNYLNNKMVEESIPGPGLSNPQENYAIIHCENPIMLQMGQATRDSHKGTYYKTDGPFTTTPKNEYWANKMREAIKKYTGN